MKSNEAERVDDRARPTSPGAEAPLPVRGRGPVEPGPADEKEIERRLREAERAREEAERLSEDRGDEKPLGRIGGSPGSEPKDE